MGNTGLKKHYATAEKTGVLSISGSKLEILPVNVLSLKGTLRSLDVSINKFIHLPPEIGQFVNLKFLVLDHNKLISLPDEIGQLVKLEKLSAVNNQLTTVPSTVSKLQSLKEVLLSNNKITNFPLGFCGLRHLDVLDLCNNVIVEIPREVANLYVTELILNQNRLTTISEEISEAPRLRILRLNENCLQIQSIPISLLKDSRVSSLEVEGNMFKIKEFTNLEGYEAYMERFTEVKKKLLN